MTEAIQHLINGLGTIPPLAIYGFVFVWLAAESSGLPLPNELVLLAAGSLAAQHSQHSVSPVVLVIVATAASVLGASAAYEIGRRGGRAAVLRFGRYIRLDEARLDTVERWFERAGPLAIGISRVTPFVRTVASFPAGMLRLPFRTFLVVAALGSLVWCTVMVTLGVLLGANYVTALKLIERYTIPAIIVVVALFVGYLWIHRRIARLSEGRRERAERDASDPKSQRDKPV